jgi:hypothetical protein
MTGKVPSQRKQFQDFVKPLDRDQLKQRAITAMAILGGLYAVLSIVVWLWPSSNEVDPTPGNSNVPSAILVAGFARDYVTTYLTAHVGDEDKLARYITLDKVKLPPVSPKFTDTDVAFAKQVSITGDGVAVWTVTVSGVINGDTTAAPQRTYYRPEQRAPRDRAAHAGGRTEHRCRPEAGLPQQRRPGLTARADRRRIRHVLPHGRR